MLGNIAFGLLRKKFHDYFMTSGSYKGFKGKDQNRGKNGKPLL